MDAVTAINQRIAEIQSRITQFEPQPPYRVDSALSGATFADVLSSVQPGAATTSAARIAVDAGLRRIAGQREQRAAGLPGLWQRPDPRRRAEHDLDGTSHQLWGPRHASFEAMRSAAAADGVTIGITDSYRSYAGQVDVAARKGLYSQGGLASVPGTSNHGWGMALDLDLDSSALTWMRQHGDRVRLRRRRPARVVALGLPPHALTRPSTHRPGAAGGAATAPGSRSGPCRSR